MPTTVRLDSETEQRLDRLAAVTGRSKAFYLRRLIEDHLSDLEDAYLAEHVLERIRTGQEGTVSHEALWRELED